ncbi:hypothetical protein J5N97_016934 [Dioscorea zingiberensis]|uniref:RNA helicase n=1 Tax=Dioscorea zingiberensis TaxID=325984 RepID=A0A9D5CL58_9LILI|nr:hypothetical protein J5N97_016934 [Dioscorea zingiberensis]
MTAAASNPPTSGPRYAPDDPSLPKPWKGLVDGSTGYIYYWNPVTNVTQYERPVPEQLPPPPPLPAPPPNQVSSSVRVYDQPPAGGAGSGRRGGHEDDGRQSGPRGHQHQGGKGGGPYIMNGPTSVGLESSSAHGRGHGVQSTRVTGRGRGTSDTNSSLLDAYRCQHEITVTGEDIPAPYTTFESTEFPSEILREVHHAGFSAPTPIQAQSWPIALSGRDIVAIAKTGSGKTLGYLLPGFIHIKHLRNNSRMGPTVLVLSPTRELATQIQEEAVKFGRSSRISSACLYGGAPKGPQLRDMDRGVDVVVATPGRLNDILEMKRVSLRQVTYLVLDEADRMLDMGFEPQIRKIVNEIPPRRQTLMFTATWPKEVRKIAADLLVNPVQVNIGNIDTLVANKAITQYIEVITPMEKQRRLEQILRSQEPGSKVIIFCSTKRMCDQLTRTLTRQFGAAAIHGDKSQSERDWVLNSFRSGKSPILVATDVAARGLDIKDIRVVINYDFPTGVEDYVHRIGRTGRAGATGVSYTFFCDQDAKYASDLVKVLEGAGQRVPSELRAMVTRGGYGNKLRRWGPTSNARDGGRSLGGSFGGRGGREPPAAFGRSDGGRGGRLRSRSPPRERYDRAYQDGRERDVETRGRYDTKGNAPVGDHRAGVRVHSRSRSRSRSPYKGHSGWGSGRKHSRSRSPYKSRRGWGGGRSQSRSRSRSRSRSGSQGINRYHGAGPAREQSPPRRKPLPMDHLTRGTIDSSPPQRSSPSKNVSVREAVSGRERSPSHRHKGELSLSPVQRQWLSPHRPNDVQGRDVNGPSTQQSSLLDDGEEEEEGMIPADDEGVKAHEPHAFN